jgi:hypothetical protein
MSVETFVQKIISVRAEETAPDEITVLIQQGDHYVFIDVPNDQKAGELAALLIECGCTSLDPHRRYL